MSDFMDSMKKTLVSRTQLTENGAVGYETSGQKLVDLNFATASLRKKSDREIVDMFMKAFYEDKLLALKWLFYVRDTREGIGERRTFRVILKALANEQPEIAKALVPIVAEYGRYDDLWVLLDTKLSNVVIDHVRTQWRKDVEAFDKKEPISLLTKWLPSINASSSTTKRYGKIIAKGLGGTQKQYRQLLSIMRKYLKIVERDMCAKQWSNIDYSAVPSQANLKYNSAFLRNDEKRRREFLSKLASGDKSVKINAGTLFPPDIVHKYCRNDIWLGTSLNQYDETLEQLWKALPDTVQDCGNIMVVGDGSGSMTTTVDAHSGVTALNVANAFEIYFSERAGGAFKDKYITFSERPQYVDLSLGKNLREKIAIALRHDEVADTNIEAVFDLILKTACDNHMTQEEIPSVLIISDMEFNSCVISNDVYRNSRANKALFEVIAARYAAQGYKLPKCIFWNVASRTGTVPLQQNEMGVVLVSGFSVNTVKMVLSGEMSPYKALVEQLNKERYQAVEELVKELL